MRVRAPAWPWRTRWSGCPSPPRFRRRQLGIPYFRLGLDTPVDAPLACAKALALVSGGAAHLAAVVDLPGRERRRSGARWRRPWRAPAIRARRPPGRARAARCLAARSAVHGPGIGSGRTSTALSRSRRAPACRRRAEAQARSGFRGGRPWRAGASLRRPRRALRPRPSSTVASIAHPALGRLRPLRLEQEARRHRPRQPAVLRPLEGEAHGQGGHGARDADVGEPPLLLDAALRHRARVRAGALPPSRPGRRAGTPGPWPRAGS